MKRIRAFALLLVLCLLLSACGGTQTPLERTAKYLKSAVPEPGFGSLDGDWIVFGLRVPGQICRTDILTGIIRRSKPPCRRQTEPSTRTGIPSIPPDPCPHGDRARPQNVGRYNLLLPLADLERRRHRASTARRSRCWRWTAAAMSSRRIPQPPCRRRATAMSTQF